MIKDNQTLLNRIHVVVDALVIACTYIAAWFIQFEFFAPDVAGKLPLETYMSALVILIPGLLLLYHAFSLYTPKRVQGRRLEFGNIVKANTIALLLFFTIAYMQHEIDFSRKMLCIFYALNIVVETLVRNLIRMVLMSLRRRGLNQKQILLVGYSRAAEQYIDRIIANPQWGYRVRGILDDNVARGTMYKGIKVIGRIENLVVILPENCLDEIAITLGLGEYEKLTRPYTEDLLGLPVINIRHVPLTNTFNSMVKRSIDIFGALVAIILFSPIMLISAILVKTTSKGPLIFRQERVGLHNKPFYMYKFRSMAVQEIKDEKAAWTTKNDPRVTGIGKIMRKTSIDELPQLFNVLKGDMSLVGPRPERPQFVEKFREEIPRYMVKHQVRPGMTGWAQINGYRGDTSIKRRIEFDLYYIENWTVGLDIKILILTIFKGFINKNAY